MRGATVWGTPDYFAVSNDVIGKERHLVESIIPGHKVIYSSQNFEGVAAKRLSTVVHEFGKRLPT